jgi:hypothetical protein
MRILTVGLMACLGSYCVAAALADEVKPQASPAAQSAPSTAAPACTPSAAAPCPAASAPTTVAASSPADSMKATEAAQDKTLRSRGFKPVTRNGSTVYCRRETQIGSHLETSVCAPADQLIANERDIKDTMDKIAREQPGPAGK